MLQVANKGFFEHVNVLPEWEKYSIGLYYYNFDEGMLSIKKI